MSLFRRRPASPSVAAAGEDVPALPRPATLYSDYVRRKPPPQAPAQRPSVPAYMYIDPLEGPPRHKLVLLLEQHQPEMACPDPRFRHVAHLMAHLTIERIVAVRGDLSLRDAGYPPMSPFDRIAGLVLEEDAPLALDVIGAWADSYARLPNTPWLRDDERAFLQGVEEVLSQTIFAVRGREIILRKDLGAAVLVDRAIESLVTSNPELRAVDAKLREALDELAGHNDADAITDAGTALQMLLEHLGYTGATIGDQLKAAQRAGWLTGVDTPLAQAIESVVTWIASVRNQRSDAHHGPSASVKDAEFVVRMVGLLVVRFG